MQNRSDVGAPKKRILTQKTGANTDDDRHRRASDTNRCSGKRRGTFTHLSKRIMHADSILVPLTQIPYVDNPEFQIDEHESTEMPFRYMMNGRGLPIMPDVSRPHLYLVVTN